MRFNTDLFPVDSKPQFGSFAQSQTIHWELWFSEKNLITHDPCVDVYIFPVKPTKRQVRKLRRQFRKAFTL